MSQTGVRTRYHVAINNIGFMLRGAPTRPRYLKQDAPTLVNRLGLGDLDYNSLNGTGWSYWTQTDWAGGFQKIKFQEDGSFKNGSGIDATYKYGEVRLQRGFISAASISGGYSRQSHAVHQHKLLLGLGNGVSAKVYSLTSAHTLATVSAMNNMSAVNSMDRFGTDTVIGLSRISAASSAATTNTMVKYTGSSISGFRSANPSVRSVKAVGARLYSGENVRSLSGDVLYYTTDLSAFTSAYQAGKNRTIPKIHEVGGKPYFFIRDGNTVEMRLWDEQGERSYVIQKWLDLTNLGVTTYLSYMIISGTTAGKRIAFAFNGARLWQIFDDQLRDASYDFSDPFEFDGNLHTKGAFWDGQFWFPGLYGQFNGKQYTPFVNFGNEAYGSTITGSVLKVAQTSAGSYAASGHIESSNFGYNIGGIDKLVNIAIASFNTLSTGQTVEIQRSTNAGTSFTSLGTATYATDGAISGKVFQMPSGFITKLWEYKAILKGPGSTTPVVQDITFEYRPIPDMRRRWQLTLDMGDNVKLLNKQDEHRSGRDIISQLWLEKESKRTVRFEDVDGWQTTLISAFNSAHTSARVKSVKDMPPKGRMRIISAGVVEEMIYTSADGTRVLGIARGKKGTKARTYAAGTSTDNFYNAIVDNISQQLNDTDDQKTESLATVILLEA